MRYLCLALLTALPALAEPLIAFDFEDANLIKPPAKQVDAPGGHALQISNLDPDGSVAVLLDLPAERLAGQRVTLSAKVKAEGVSTPPNTWNGVKVMLVVETAGGKQHPQLPLAVGTYDWITKERTLRLPAATTKVQLHLGLEKCSGTATFDDVSLSLWERPGNAQRFATKYTGHSLDRLRGVMHGPKFNDDHLRYLAEVWGANQVRWQLNWTPMKAAEEWAKDPEALDKWLDGALEQTDLAVEACRKYGLMMLLDLHTPPGGRVEQGVCRLFQEQRYQDHFLRIWRRIATRYKGNPVVYAYDLVNEPVEGKVAEGLMNWRELATAATKVIREVDPGHAVVFEPGPWGGPDGFADLLPLEVDHVIYSFHMYLPHAFTHQGVHGMAQGLVYPGTIAGEHWDKERLREAMIAAIEFQREFNVQMYVGEFSAIRWAPDNSAYRWLKDVTDLFEEYGWDWSYHAFREWEGWSAEHGTDEQVKTKADAPTDRELLLRGWFAKAERPTF